MQGFDRKVTPPPALLHACVARPTISHSPDFLRSTTANNSSPALSLRLNRPCNLPENFIRASGFPHECFAQIPALSPLKKC